jgi:hypothetical protein
MHYHYIEDSAGDLVDVWEFCSDACNRSYCEEVERPYQGWSGCHEAEFDTVCVECGTKIPGTNGPA